MVTNYCYASCSGDGDCECDHKCKSIGGESVCVATSTGEGNWELTVWQKGIVPGQDKEFEAASFEIEYDERTIKFTMASALDESTDLLGEEGEDFVAATFQGAVGTKELWFLHLIVPRDAWNEGGEQAVAIDDANSGFTAYLLKGALSATQLSQLWIEAASNGGTVTVDEPGEPCWGTNCPKSKGSFTIEFAGMMSEVSVDSVNFAAAIAK